MGSRDIHSRDGGTKVRDFLGSLLTNLILSKNLEKPIYLISPGCPISAFLKINLANSRICLSGESNSENPKIFFSQVLLNFLPKSNKTCPPKSHQRNSDCFPMRRAKTKFKLDTNGTEHQKGFLSEKFYFEGSMNFTYSGIQK